MHTKDESRPLLDKGIASHGGLGDTSPSEMGGAFSSVFFAWLTPLMDLGSKRPLEFDDLYQLNANNRAAYISTTFKKNWAIELTKPKPRLWLALARSFGGPFIAAGFLKLLHDSLQFVGPMAIKYIIAFLSDPTAELTTGLTYVLAIFAAGVVQSFSLRQYFFLCFETGMRVRSSIVTAVYDKSLVLASSSKKSTGEITNLMSVDAQRLQEITNYLHAIWFALFQMAVTSTLLYMQLGVAYFAAFAIMVLLVPVTTAVSNLMQTLQQALMQVKDERVNVVYEVLRGIKVIKLQAWEHSFTNRVMQFRSNELSKLRAYVYARGAATMVFNGVPTLVTVASFFGYVYLGNTLDVGTALTSLALLNILRYPLFMLPYVINSLAEAQVSFSRLEELLLMDEREPVTAGPLKDTAILLQHADFEWDAAQETTDVAHVVAEDGPILHNVNLKLTDGSLVAVVGAVGSGKSTLLSGILGDARCAKVGQVHRFGSVAYVSQQPFIQNATLRDNITFGLAFDHARYQTAIRVSSLLEDLKILPGGDLTEIGEKGVNLSGGQRTRVAIARAVYQDADIYLLDDPLAAVDAHVGSDIFKQCIKTALNGKLVVLVTNGLNFLKDCDSVVVLEQGRIVEQGAYQSLVDKVDGVLAKMMESVQEAPDKEKDDTDVPRDNDQEEDEREHDARQRTESNRSDVDTDKVSNAALISDEDRSTGDVPWGMYKRTRVAIARAVYQDADIYLLDDPLAAVDAHVGSDIFKQCIKTALNGKLVVLVTNGLNFLKDCDSVVVLEQGRIIEQGAYQSLVDKVDGVLAKMMESVQEAPDKEKDDTDVPRDNDQEEDEREHDARQRTESNRSDVDTDKVSNAALISDEDRSTGDVPWGMYKVWIDACGGVGVGLAVGLLYLVTSCVNLLASLWLSIWGERNSATSSQYYYLYMYIGLNGVGIGLLFVQTLALFLAGLRGSSTMFNQLLTQVLRAPLSFFDTTPLGRIVNRMGKDVYAIDETIPANWGMLLGATFSFITTIGMVVYATPWFTVLLPPLAGFYYVSQRYYIRTSRELKRLDSISRSPVVALMTETLEGIPTIRAFSAEPQFTTRNHYLLDQNQRAYFLSVSTNSWLSLRLELAGAVVTASAALFAVLNHDTAQAGVAFAGLAGVALSCTLNVTQNLNWTVQLISTIQTQMVSVERIHAYTTMQVEADLDSDPIKTLELEHAKWPSQGKLTFKDVDLRYRAGLPRVLRKLTFTINAHEKIGIVGRTGAGKSSLVVALMRLVELDGGVITLDDVDISTIATASIDANTDRLIQESIRDSFKDCTCLTIAHRINTILDSDRILVMDKGSAAEFDTPAQLLKNPNGIFNNLVEHWRDDNKSA
ncbi:hypothetical protein H257_14523 [Aphanomyces astaci]|uniref:Multidrug resistance-associated protein 1 n=1 Tax=Aphanomyces astaci TaxID=112090 RepID=W4FSJ9_APHAT|nr:hypothetical protein H257_14523 [Aphanomyces astaci]ETV69926.1 hypothetical protein H257_14523 [Aphanomyces astaci]|eukprot:XP_009840664.1 hypothetical protein H257_14523 [Aphanomyces astaci]